MKKYLILLFVLVSIISNVYGESIMKIQVNNQEFNVILENNPTTETLINMLPLQLKMSAMAHEKYYKFPNSLPSNDYFPDIIKAGDVMLYDSKYIVIFYETFKSSYYYTRIGRIENTTGLARALGEGNVMASFSVK
ncbi:MAG: hypothetical protein LBQ34_06030 [Alphaproteobacteria bacterium]|jgi:hypothetical protein|nr:hypothetical protein [Alphaproteobacteria bacterium]